MSTSRSMNDEGRRVSRDFDESACALSSRRTPAAMQRGGPGSLTKDDLKPLLALCCWLIAAAPVHVAAQAVPATPETATPPEPVGRLFFTPPQRQQLDVARVQRARTTLATEKTEEVSTAAPVPQTLTYDGAVRRSDGKTTVWINSRPVNDKDPASGAVIVGRVRPDGSVSLQMPQSGRSVELKPGQSVELLSGQIEDGLSRKPVAAPVEPKPAPKGAAPEARGDKSAAAAERARVERDREDRERQLDEAARALRDTTAAKPPGGTAAPR